MSEVQANSKILDRKGEWGQREREQETYTTSTPTPSLTLGFINITTTIVQILLLDVGRTTTKAGKTRCPYYYH